MHRFLPRRSVAGTLWFARRGGRVGAKSVIAFAAIFGWSIWSGVSTINALRYPRRPVALAGGSAGGLLWEVGDVGGVVEEGEALGGVCLVIEGSLC